MAVSSGMWFLKKKPHFATIRNIQTLFIKLKIMSECGELWQNVVFFLNHISPRDQDFMFHKKPHYTTKYLAPSGATFRHIP